MPLSGRRSPTSPPAGAPLRVAFVGSLPTMGAHVLHEASAGLAPTVIDVRAGADASAVRMALGAAAPHVVIVLEPGIVESGALDGLDATLLAVLGPDAPEPAAGVVDRVLRTPGGGSEHRAWRTRPLPIDDRLYLPPRLSRHPPRALCLGRSTEYREWLLTPAKHNYDVTHYAHGVTGPALLSALSAADIGIAAAPDARRHFPAQALMHLAASHLLIAPELAPSCGLEPGIDHLQLSSRRELLTILFQLERRPESSDRIRIRGRLKAEEHRASRVWPRIAHDLIEDVRAFGTARTLHG